MWNKINKFISHPVVSKVVGGLLLVGVLWGLAYVKGFYSTAWGILKSVPALLIVSVGLPLWSVVLLAFLSIGGAVSLKRKVFPATRLPAHVVKYREAPFFGVLWRWGYFHNRIPHKFRSFCPNCDTELVLQRSISAYRCLGADEWLHCETCDAKLLDLECPLDELKQRVKRQVDKNIRTAAWKQG